MADDDDVGFFESLKDSIFHRFNVMYYGEDYANFLRRQEEMASTPTVPLRLHIESGNPLSQEDPNSQKMREIEALIDRYESDVERERQRELGLQRIIQTTLCHIKSSNSTNACVVGHNTSNGYGTADEGGNRRRTAAAGRSAGGGYATETGGRVPNRNAQPQIRPQDKRKLERYLFEMKQCRLKIARCDQNLALLRQTQGNVESLIRNKETQDALKSMQTIMQGMKGLNLNDVTETLSGLEEQSDMIENVSNAFEVSLPVSTDDFDSLCEEFGVSLNGEIEPMHMTSTTLGVVSPEMMYNGPTRENAFVDPARRYRSNKNAIPNSIFM
jgi:hypothetical protein